MLCLPIEVTRMKARCWFAFLCLPATPPPCHLSSKCHILPYTIGFEWAQHRYISPVMTKNARFTNAILLEVVEWIRSHQQITTWQKNCNRILVSIFLVIIEKTFYKCAWITYYDTSIIWYLRSHACHTNICRT